MEDDEILEILELAVPAHTKINVTIVPSGSSLLDMLHQEHSRTAVEEDRSSVNRNVGGKNDCVNNSKLLTLFNPTGRERNSTTPLKHWLYEHRDHPYPKDSDRQELMRKTKMSASQITIWFTNARVKMRKEKKLSSSIHGKTPKKQQQRVSSIPLKEPQDFILVSDDETYEPKIYLPNPVVHRQIIMAYSSLNRNEISELERLASIYSHQLFVTDRVDEHTTHLVTGNEQKPLLCPLTMKLFHSIARHLFVITYRWVDDCLKQNDLIDEVNYEIRGDIPFGDYHDGMRKSRLLPDVKLLQNCQFFILCDGCQDKMSKVELSSLIQLCHGSLLDVFPITTATDKSVLTIVLTDKIIPFHTAGQQQLFELSRSNGVFFLNPEWILESLVQFALQPFEFYEEEF